MFSKREFGSRQGRMASSSFKETMDPAVAQSALLRAYEQANGDHGSNRYGKPPIKWYCRLPTSYLDMWLLAYNCVSWIIISESRPVVWLWWRWMGMTRSENVNSKVMSCYSFFGVAYTFRTCTNLCLGRQYSVVKIFFAVHMNTRLISISHTAALSLKIMVNY